MTKYLQLHQKYIENLLEIDSKDTNWKNIRNFHLKQILFLQHERYIHLFVTLFVALFDLLCIFFALQLVNVLFFVAVLLLTALLIPYLFHYMALENGVQKLYDLYNKIEKQIDNSK